MNLYCIKFFSILIIGLTSFNLAAQTSCVFAKDIKVNSLQIGNLLEWTTLEEQNNEYFVIQRSFDGLEFETFAELESQGNSKKEQNYQHLDTSLGMKRVFYRLEQLQFLEP